MRALRPHKVLEWGTGYGLSALHIAAALRDNNQGLLITIEKDARRQGAAIANLRQAGLMEWVVTGTPEFMPDDGPYQFVFLDAGHTTEDVAEYLAWVRPRLAHGAPIIVHDAMYQRHVIPFREQGWHVIEVPGTGFAGLAILAPEW